MYPRTVVLLTTWNRPTLLRQSLPQIEAESDRIGARLVVSDDQSDDPETLALLEDAQSRGVEVIRREYLRVRDIPAEAHVHHEPRVALSALVEDPTNGERASKLADGIPPYGELYRLLARRERARQRVHVCAQWNNLFGFRHILRTDAQVELILKVDDDVVMVEGAFARMLQIWERATDAGHDVLLLSGLRTVYEPVTKQFYGYAVTERACNAAILYRRSDWKGYLPHVREELIIVDGFDCAFLEQYAPAYRSGAVCITVTPSVVFHAGRMGMHVRGLDLNLDFRGSLDGVAVE